MAWEYKRNESAGFDVVPEGRHRVRVEKAERQVSKNGYDMIKLTFEVSGCNSRLFHYIVFLPDRPEITNRNLTQFFDSFPGIQEGDFVESNWVGKTGACVVKHELYNGEPSAKIKNFIKADKQGDLPAWKEPGRGSSVKSTDAAPTGFQPTDDDLPIW